MTALKADFDRMIDATKVVGELKKLGFKKKYSLIKKLEVNKDIFELIMP
jgi:hypothetical protein